MSNHHQAHRLTTRHQGQNLRSIQEQTNLLTDIKNNTANINVNVGDVEINVQDVEALISTSNAKLIEISGKNTDIDLSVKANTLTIAKLDQILVKNTNNETLLTAISAKTTDVDDSTKANTLTINKLNQILVKNGELKTLLTDISAKTSDVDNSVVASANVVSKLTQIKNLTDTFDAVLDASLVVHTAGEIHLGNIDTGIDVLEACVGSNKVNVNVSSGTISLPSGSATEAKQDVMESSLNSIQSAVEGTLNVASHAVTNAGTFVTQNTTQNPFNGAVTHTALTQLAAAINLDRVDVTITNNISGFSTSAKQDVIEASLTSMEGKMDVDNVVFDNQLTKLTNNETLLTAIDADTNNIKTSTAACATDLAAIEVLQTAANTDLAAIEVLLTSANTDHAANEALLITIDEDTNNIKTSTAACATDLAAIEVLQTAIKTTLLETESAIEVIEACVDSSVLKTKAQKTFISPTLIIFLNDAADPAAGTTTTKTIAGSGNFTSNATANDPNIDSYIFQHVFTDSDCSYEVFEGLTSGGTFFALQPAFNAGGGAPTANSLINIVRVELPFFKVKVTNANAAARNATITFIGKTSV